MKLRNTILAAVAASAAWTGLSHAEPIFVTPSGAAYYYGPHGYPYPAYGLGPAYGYPEYHGPGSRPAYRYPEYGANYDNGARVYNVRPYRDQRRQW